MKEKITFFTAHHQFYIADKGSDDDTGGDFWSDSAQDNRLAVGSRLLGISTESYGRIQATITVRKNRPEVQDLAKFDHVVEAGLTIESGVIQIADCPNFAIRMEIGVPPGRYRARVSSANLEGVEEDDGEDYYIIDIWPDNDSGVKVLKRFGAR